MKKLRCAVREICGIHSPGRDDVDAASVVVRRSSQGVHDPAHGPLARAVLWDAQAVEERGARADQDQAGVLLCFGRGVAVLFDEVVGREFGGVERAGDVDVHDLEIGLFE